MDFSDVFVQYLNRNSIKYLRRYFAPGFGQHFARFFGSELVRYLGQYLGLSEATITATWFSTFVFLETSSSAGRASPRATLTHGRIPDGAPLLALFRAACRASFSPDDADLRAAAAHACDAFDGDPLWPALARHVARISTAQDRTLLEDLALHPEQRQPPLSWGLQHYVRGDLVLDDDSVVTLDELCTQAGLATLPLLQDMPDELDIVADTATPSDPHIKIRS